MSANSDNSPAEPGDRSVSIQIVSGHDKPLQMMSLDLSSVFGALRQRVPTSQQAQAEAFARIFYQRMTRDEFVQHSPDAWAALAADFLSLARMRKPGEADVRVFNATLAQQGWESPHTTIQIVNDDMPFLVDSVTMAMAEQGIAVHVLGHPVVNMTRDAEGDLLAVGDGLPESLIHMEIDRQSTDAMQGVERTIRSSLCDVRAIVADWNAMRAKLFAVADELSTRAMPIPDTGRAEAQEFLR
jgi:glutamate dehydrogenase